MKHTYILARKKNIFSFGHPSMFSLDRCSVISDPIGSGAAPGNWHMSWVIWRNQPSLWMQRSGSEDGGFLSYRPDKSTWCKTGDSPWFINRDSLFHCFFCQYMGGFLKCWYPKTMGFPTKNDNFGVFWGYHHLRKHPHTIHLFQCEDLFFGWLLKRDPELTLQGCCMWLFVISNV